MSAFCVIDPCPVNRCSHSIFLWNDKVLRPPVEPATLNGHSGVSEKTELEDINCYFDPIENYISGL